MLQDDSIKSLSNNIWRQRLWQESVPKNGVEHIEGNGRLYSYLYPIKDLNQRSFHKSFHVCTDLVNSELKINKNLNKGEFRLYNIRDLNQGNFHRNIHVCID